MCHHPLGEKFPLFFSSIISIFRFRDQTKSAVLPFAKGTIEAIKSLTGWEKNCVLLLSWRAAHCGKGRSLQAGCSVWCCAFVYTRWLRTWLLSPFAAGAWPILLGMKLLLVYSVLCSPGDWGNKLPSNFRCMWKRSNSEVSVLPCKYKEWAMWEHLH